MERREDTAWLYRRLEEMVQRLNLQFYKYEIHGLRERLQYTIYEQAEGGHYGWHVDHGAATPEPRKLSLSLQLTDPHTYEGCDLELSYGDGVKQAPRSRGTLIAFPSYVLHQVTPIVSGTRKSLVIWASGPDFR
jgi:predicted 2-oxoglutarate/Fe(II)-dependent dioxygenase YbiX